MADGFIRVPVDGVGKRVDTEELTVSSLTVQRERDIIAGAGPLEISRVLNTDPSGTDYGLVVRQAPEVNPIVDQITSSALVAGTSVDLDGSTISAATTGKLLRVIVGSSIPCRWDVKTHDGGVEVTRAVLYTSGITGGIPSWDYEPKSKDGITLAGAGVDENFRVTVTNLGTLATLEDADVHATIEWDEV